MTMIDDRSPRRAILALLSLLIISCDEPSEMFTVAGYVYSDGKLVPNVNVVIDNSVNMTTQTNSGGYFEFGNITKGIHEISASATFDNGSFSALDGHISVSDDLLIGELVLPTPSLLETSVDQSDPSISLKWTKSDDIQFREYRLYRYLTAALDPDSSTLVYTGTARSDTTFIDNLLSPSKMYYYRLIIRDENAQISGSNVVESITAAIDYIHNGGFELSEDPLIWWNLDFGAIILDTLVAVGGRQALRMEADTTAINESGSAWQGVRISKKLNLSNFTLEPNRKYRLSGWIKTEGTSKWLFGAYGDPAHIRLDVGYPSVMIFLISESNTDWTYYESEFICPASYMFEGGYIYLQAGSQYAWFDDLKLEAL